MRFFMVYSNQWAIGNKPIGIASLAAVLKRAGHEFQLFDCTKYKLTQARMDSTEMPNINVTVYDSTENKRVPVELPDDAPCNKIVAVLVQKLRLPTNGPDGAPLSYKFHHKNSGRQVQDTQTLAEAQVQDGDILRLQPEITAG